MKFKFFLKQIRHWLIPKGLFAIVLNLIIHRADKKQWRLNIGSYLLRKGTGFRIGDIVETKKLTEDLVRAKVITGLFYDFKTNKVTHTCEKQTIRLKDN